MKKFLFSLAAVLAAPVVFPAAAVFPAVFSAEWQKAKNGGF